MTAINLIGKILLSIFAVFMMTGFIVKREEMWMDDYLRFNRGSFVAWCLCLVALLVMLVGVWI